MDETPGDFGRDEELLAEVRRDGLPRVIVERPREAAVVLGRGGRAEVELDLDACAAEGIPILRRRGGGCAVVIDPGNVIVSVALPLEGIGRNDRHFDRLSRWLIAALAKVGIEGLYQDGTSDLVRDDRKVGGSCLWRPRGFLYYSTTLLVSGDLPRVTRCLKHPPREPAYRRGRSHEEFITNLGERGGTAEVEHLERDLRATLFPDEVARILAE
jgi:lipoate---protein ligase